MGLFEQKSWLAQDFYNEYLELKTDIAERVKIVDYQKHVSSTMTNAGLEELDMELHQKVKRLRFVLNQLKLVHGIALEDLILLSIGIDPTTVAPE